MIRRIKGNGYAGLPSAVLGSNSALFCFLLLYLFLGNFGRIFCSLVLVVCMSLLFPVSSCTLYFIRLTHLYQHPIHNLKRFTCSSALFTLVLIETNDRLSSGCSIETLQACLFRFGGKTMFPRYALHALLPRIANTHYLLIAADTDFLCITRRKTRTSARIFRNTLCKNSVLQTSICWQFERLV